MKEIPMDESFSHTVVVYDSHPSSFGDGYSRDTCFYPTYTVSIGFMSDSLCDELMLTHEERETNDSICGLVLNIHDGDEGIRQVKVFDASNMLTTTNCEHMPEACQVPLDLFAEAIDTLNDFYSDYFDV